MSKINLACIIDDDPIYIFGTKKIMQMADFCTSFLVYNNGKNALLGLSEIIASGYGLPDIIILDLNMPIMDGWEFLDQFIKIPNSKIITVYIASSSIDPLDIKKAKMYQRVSNYIVKPISKEVLISISQEALVKDKLHKNSL